MKLLYTKDGKYYTSPDEYLDTREEAEAVIREKLKGYDEFNEMRKNSKFALPMLVKRELYEGMWVKEEEIPEYPYSVD